MVILQNNLPYLIATIHNGQASHTPFGESAPGNQMYNNQGYAMAEAPPQFDGDVSVMYLQNPNHINEQVPNTMNMQNGVDFRHQYQQQQANDIVLNGSTEAQQMVQTMINSPPLQLHENFVGQQGQQPHNPQNRNLQAMGQQPIYQQPLPNADYSNYQSSNIVPELYHHPFAGYYNKLPYLLLSSLLGIIIGDLAELEALRLIGARRILMVYTIKPFAAALLGNVLLDEPIYIAAFFGMILTALGVYYVLVASLEKFERKRRKSSRGSAKRKIDSFLFSGSDDDKSFDTGSIGSFNEDEEIAGILNGDLSGDYDNSNGVDNFRMGGMRRRPLSRHDLTSDFFDDHDYGGGGEEDEVTMMIVDGRGVIDTTINCIKPASSGSNESSDGWDQYSSANQSFDSMNSLEKLDVDVMVAMENFENDYDDDLIESPSHQNLASSILLLETKSTNDIPKQSDTRNMLQTTSEKPLKSALRQSKYGGTQSSSFSTSNDNDTSGPLTKKVFESLPPIKKKSFHRVMRRSNRSSDSLGSIASMGSLASFESECGPPPGMYNHSRKESRLERKVRIRTGYVLATFNVILDAYCSYLTKKHGEGLNTWEINLCRLGFAGLILTLIATVMKHRERRLKRRLGGDDQPDYQAAYFGPVSNESKMKFRPWYRLPKMAAYPWMVVSMGVFFVTFLSPALANYSLFQIPLALSISLTSITPLFTIPLGICTKGDKPTLKGYVGTALSAMGIVILCVWGVDSSTL